MPPERKLSLEDFRNKPRIVIMGAAPTLCADSPRQHGCRAYFWNTNDQSLNDFNKRLVNIRLSISIHRHCVAYVSLNLSAWFMSYCFWYLEAGQRGLCHYRALHSGSPAFGFIILYVHIGIENYSSLKKKTIKKTVDAIAAERIFIEKYHRKEFCHDGLLISYFMYNSKEVIFAKSCGQIQQSHKTSL